MVSKTESPPLIGPRISFSSDGGDFICISSLSICKELENVSDFEFLSENVPPEKMLTADELFSEGMLLPYRKVEKLKNMKTNEEEEVMMMMKSKDQEINNNNRVSWFIDEDPSPRPPNCTVLWKELLRLKKQRNSSSSSSSSSSSLSPSSSTSSSSSVKKGLERTRSGTMRIRPMIHVPICTVSSKSSVPLPPLFPLTVKKNRVEKRS